METITYFITKERGLKYSLEKFRKQVTRIIKSPSFWENFKFKKSKTLRDADIIIQLTSNKTIERHCPEIKGLSCASAKDDITYINYDRWTKGSKSSKLKLNKYRKYLIQHEVGHLLLFHLNKFYDHHYPENICDSDIKNAPIMMQQTNGIGKCKPNSVITEYDYLIFDSF